MGQRKLNIWYSLGQVFYYAAFSAAVGFAGVYLLDRGFNNFQIGLVYSLGNFISIFLPPGLASFLGRHPAFGLSGLITAAAAFIGLNAAALWLAGLGKLGAGIALTAIVAALFTLMPFMNSLAFIYEGRGIKVNFGIARGLGSGAYALAAMALGKITAGSSPKVLPAFCLGFTALMALSVLAYRRSGPAPLAKEAAADTILPSGRVLSRYPRFLAFLAGFVLVYLGHTFINNFLIQILIPVGGTDADLGTAVFISAILEVPVMFWFARISRRAGSAGILRFSAAMFALKHLLTWLADSVALVYLAQSLQLFAYALFVPASVYYVNETLAPADRLKGQALASAAMSLAGVLSAALGGISLDFAGVRATLLVVSLISLAGAAIIFLAVRKEPGSQARRDI